MKTLIVILLLFFSWHTSSSQYLSKTQWLQAAEKVKTLLSKDQKSKVLHLQLAQVYSKLAFNYKEGRQPEKAQSYLDSAQAYYGKTLDIDPEYFEALFNYGSMFYNVSVEYDKDRQQLSLSAQTEYIELTEIINNLIGNAHHHFVRAEKANPNSLELVMVFKEIYLRTNNIEPYLEYKTRIQTKQQDQNTSFQSYTKHPDSKDVKL